MQVIDTLRVNYRYGFNGKEKDDDGEFGNTTYDYGFRIYNPSIGRFLSVDPLTAVYAELTPYQFASNKPINSIDLDGLEARTSIKGEFVDGHWTMGSDNHISLQHEAELRMQAEQAMKNKPFTPNYGTLRSNDITSTPRYKMFEFNVNTYGDFVLPIDVSKRLIRGEEVPAWEIGIEVAGIIPIAKLAKPLKYLDESIEVVSKVVKNSFGDDVIRTFVKNEDDLLKVAEDAAGGSLDKFKEIKPGWWEGVIDGKKKRIEWQPGGEASTAEGPHVKVLEWIEGAGKNGKGKWKTSEKYFIEGQETYKTMTSIGISEFTRNISKVLHVPLKEKSDLLPSVLFNKIKDTTHGLTWTSIPRWNLFEHGNEEWGMDEFLALVQYKEGDELQILTDRLYQDDEAVLYKNIDRSTFEDAYGNKYGEEFFQPLDYVVIKNNEQVILLHHEGLLAFA